MREEGRRIDIRGTVQGVGFRPAVFRLARRLGLAGRVSNSSDGVVIEVFGDGERIDELIHDLEVDSPPAAHIDRIAERAIPFEPVTAFVIDASARNDSRRMSVPPDLATCPDCLKDIEDPRNRRYRYPFTNCTNCGPRYSIMRDIPYDRATTTMQAFVMCDACRAEYESPLDRRFHAEPNACPSCGPSLTALSPDGSTLDVDDPLTFAARAVRAQLVVAVKGIGGFHLACDATSEVAVTRLRARKLREAKPLAVMVADFPMAETLATLSDVERALLVSSERPIVLVRKRDGSPLAASVAPDNDLVGLFLPYTPLHHLLVRDSRRPLVMTSGNRTGEPMVRDTRTAIARLGDIADVFLTHKRAIENRVDDSVARVIAGRPVLFRRARGFVPRGIPVSRPFARPLLATGAHLKNTFCLASGDTAFLGPHIGDLEELTTLRAYENAIERAKRLLGIQPEVVAHDLHPDYSSTRYALAQHGVEVIGVQHHHAHIASVMAEHRLDGPVAGLAWDGTGYGDDGTAWGGELFVATLAEFARLITFRPLRLPGGDKAIRDVWRIGLSALTDLSGAADRSTFFHDIPERELHVVSQMLANGVSSPAAHGVGRWFDAFGALFLGRRVSRYEGEIAMAWNAVADRGERGVYPFEIDETSRPFQIDPRLMLHSALDDFRAGVSPAVISGRFHNTLARMACAAIDISAPSLDVPIVLSGGCFQNALLTEQILHLLGPRRRVYFGQQIPPGDGGIALGQALVADARIRLSAKAESSNERLALAGGR
jgi:hydrogenase maturation protein HypF